jgi:hypothetical protein
MMDNQGHDPISEADLSSWELERLELQAALDGLDDPPPEINGKWTAGSPAAGILQLEDAALHGPIGDLVRELSPETESDPAAILFTALAYFGSAAGRNCYWKIEATRHFPVLFVALVGQTSKGRKGTAEDRVRSIFRAAAPDFIQACISSGLSSGEGLIEAVRDEIRGLDKKGEQVILAEGVSDKRMLVQEGELSRALSAMSRDGSTLSQTIRDTWDGRTLRVMNRKSNKLVATDPHVSILGHITRDELERCLTSIEAANGFANRFLWVAVKRHRELPFGGRFSRAEVFGERFRTALEWSWHNGEREVAFDDGARALWFDVYSKLSQDRPGLLGSVTARAEAQARRLALIYSIADCSPVTTRVHLEAGLAAWRYCEMSAARIFGDATGDDVADTIMEALRGMEDGMTRTEIRDLFKRHVSQKRIAVALDVLRKLGRARAESRPTRGRPEERWVATKAT